MSITRLRLLLRRRRARRALVLAGVVVISGLAVVASHLLQKHSWADSTVFAVLVLAGSVGSARLSAFVERKWGWKGGRYWGRRGKR
ncbi:hypothetical protein AB0C89_31095 [Streptomyces sp. NPDC048491]|uniref:hypothetical protein n=1 Tax=unclassified Streptomyces TaxID=2593676 RepID=UPI00344626BE